MGRRPLLVIAGWLAAAAVALVVGLAATNVIGDRLTSPAGDPISQAQAEQRLAAASALPPAPTAVSPSPSAQPALSDGPAFPSSSVSPSAPATGKRKTFPTPGGTVIARCTGSRVEILSMSPAQGYAVHERERGLDDSVEGEFRSTSDNHDRVKVNARCDAGTPTLSLRIRND